jgi:uracil-DNA glycosylase
LGSIAHGAILAAFGLTCSHWPFSHGERHRLPNRLVLADRYHCSRYNLNTGQLTEAMFHAVFEAVRDTLAAAT